MHQALHPGILNHTPREPDVRMVIDYFGSSLSFFPLPGSLSTVQLNAKKIIMAAKTSTTTHFVMSISGMLFSRFES